MNEKEGNNLAQNKYIKSHTINSRIKTNNLQFMII